MALFSFVLFLSFFGTLFVRYVARKKELLDRPNERSSHAVATPHGGGLAIMTAFYAGLVWLYIDGHVDAPLFFALLCALPVVAVSQIDDLLSLPAKVRFAVQAASAVAALYALGGTDVMAFGLFRLDGPWLNAAAFLLIVWYTNLYNFLDGIDGYAGAEAVFAGGAAFLLFGSDVGLLIAAASAGFLVFNWHRASIFMGDVGSAPLGFIFAVLTLHAAATPDFVVWIVLLSLFWFDATLTLWRRFRCRETLTQAHRKHAYQRLVQAGFSHDKVVLSAMLLNAVLFGVLWLLPQHDAWVALAAAAALLYGAVRYIDAKKAFA